MAGEKCIRGSRLELNKVNKHCLEPSLSYMIWIISVIPIGYMFHLTEPSQE